MPVMAVRIRETVELPEFTLAADRILPVAEKAYASGRPTFAMGPFFMWQEAIAAFARLTRNANEESWLRYATKCVLEGVSRPVR